MPTRPWARRIVIAGLAGRVRRRAVAGLSVGLTLPVMLAGLLALPGCRSDGTSARLPSLNPTRWLNRDEAPAEEAAAVPSETGLRPIPHDEDFADPYIPPVPAQKTDAPKSFLAPPAPAPEPVSAEDSDGFYGVRPTGAEVAAPNEPSWSNRFRSLFNRDGSAAKTSSVRPISAEAGGQPPVPPPVRIKRKAVPVALGLPEFEASRQGFEATASRHASPRTAAVNRSAERLPVISPGRAASSASGGDPGAWPHPMAKQDTLDSAPSPAPAFTDGPDPVFADAGAFEPLPIEAEPAEPLRIVPQAADEPSGPALLP